MEAAEVNEDGVYYDEQGNERWTPPKLAREIGVSQSRVRQLIEAKRIEGAVNIAGRYTFPAWPRIQSRDLTWSRGGKINDYMARQEEQAVRTKKPGHPEG